jgi:hypothetical protein
VVGTSAAATMASQNDKALQLPDPPRRDVRSPLLVSFCACVLPLCIDAAIARAVCSMLSGRLDCVWRAERGGVRQLLLTGVEMLLCSTGQRSMACRWSDESRLNFPSALFFVLAGAGRSPATQIIYNIIILQDERIGRRGLWRRLWVRCR